ncbi:hypothetical protein GUITHDRAFT_102299 [Guillardia theta CCMP2712]|uniref:Uncharacterized protein n=1 Tax=Guillardia theta (strain CCMP2712) TaxID=905079 RepID=L1JTC8_GUITC|nr:hypothetical protein GUITHDRAFT_102299 [Guillardia theta CCMP2712]EKX51692.1 hypothetical protein GUITHDRAFT_102299 [Guillardia theta CCMP2712]|eukprot:XP_005838672.1 hypothetical protein GUITHDRAFT_102299 [Guillardia theta CCMP2712]
MFELLMQQKLSDDSAAAERYHSSSSLMNGVPKPPPTYVPPTGASFMTWPNIYKNLKRIDYCTEQFDYISNRIKCITALTHGPFLQ